MGIYYQRFGQQPSASLTDLEAARKISFLPRKGLRGEVENQEL